MNELTKIKDRILERIENYIADIEFAEEKELTEDEKTIFKSVKNIINEEFEKTPAPLPRFIYEDGKIKLFKTSDEKELTHCNHENIIHFADAICRLSQTCGISHSEAKDAIEKSMEMLKSYSQTQQNIEQIIKDTIKKYLDKDYDDVTELLLALNKDLCERIRKENENGL